MIVNRRRVMGDYGGDIIPASSYIQDGLIALYDGIENAGVGRHSSSATTWVDLVGNNDLELTGSGGTWDSDHYNFNGFCRFEMEASNVSTMLFVEACFYRTGAGCLMHNNYSNCIYMDSTNCLITQGSTNLQGFTVDYNSVHTYSVDYQNWLLYQDGIVPSRGVSSRMTSYSGNTKFLVGCRCFNSASDRRNMIQGELYSLRLYNRVLTSNEMSENLAIDQQRFGVT